MRVVIPVAGAGTRLRPHTYSLPKPLLHVGGRPIIAHLLDPIVKLNPDEVVFVVGFRGEAIREYVRDNYSFKATFISQDKVLGLGYALDMGIRDLPDDDLLIILGDTIVECDLRKFVSAGDYVLGLKAVDDPRRFGIAVVNNGSVVELEEKPKEPKTNLAVIGLYYFKKVDQLRRVLNAHVASGQITRGEIQFTDALQKMIREGVRFVPYEVSEWFDCGKKETMLSTNRHLVASLHQTPELNDSRVISPVFVHPDAEVSCSVIGPNVSISENTVIKNCIIRNSIVSSNVRIENMILEDSLVGHDVVLRGKSSMVNLGDSSEIA